MWFAGFDAYRKNPKNLNTQKIVVIIVKVERHGLTIEYCVRKV